MNKKTRTKNTFTGTTPRTPRALHGAESARFQTSGAGGASSSSKNATVVARKRPALWAGVDGRPVFTTRVFFAFGAMLWIPILMGIITMVYVGKTLALCAALALAIALASFLFGCIVRNML